MRVRYFCSWCLAASAAISVLQLRASATEPARGTSKIAVEKPSLAPEGTVPEVVAFIRGYFVKLAQGDFEAVMARFDESVKLEDSETHGRAYVRDTLVRERDKWSVVTYRPTEFEVTPGDGRLAVSFCVDYVRANERIENRGRTAHVWILRRAEKNLRIISQHKVVISETTVAESDLTQRNRSLERENSADEMGRPGGKLVERSSEKVVPVSKARPEVNIVSPRAQPSESPSETPSPVRRSWFASFFLGRPSPTNSPPMEAVPENPAFENEARDNFVVAIDVGHSKKTGGAVSARGVIEYEFNRRLAFALFNHLWTSGFSRSFLINRSGEEIGLPKRAEIANAQRADLFLAIHHDSVKDKYLKDWKNSKGESQKYCDQFHGYSIFFSRKNVASERSLAFAVTLGQALLDAGFTPTLHHVEQENRPIIDRQKGVYAFDDLIVLKAAKMPAVLLECGVIVNRNEEEELNSDNYRQRMISAIDMAVQDFARRSSKDYRAN